MKHGFAPILVIAVVGISLLLVTVVLSKTFLDKKSNLETTEQSTQTEATENAKTTNENQEELKNAQQSPKASTSTTKKTTSSPTPTPDFTVSENVKITSAEPKELKNFEIVTIKGSGFGSKQCEAQKCGDAFAYSPSNPSKRYGILVNTPYWKETELKLKLLR